MKQAITLSIVLFAMSAATPSYGGGIFSRDGWNHFREKHIDPAGDAVAKPWNRSRETYLDNPRDGWNHWREGNLDNGRWAGTAAGWTCSYAAPTFVAGQFAGYTCKNWVWGVQNGLRR